MQTSTAPSTDLASHPDAATLRGEPPVDLGEALSQRQPVALADLERLGRIARNDQKFLMPAAAAGTFVRHLGPQFGVLDIDGRRDFTYTSVYFDTADLLTYHLHRQGRRRRCKIRVRHYGDASQLTLEVKCRTSRGNTLKFRRLHRAASPYLLDDEAMAFITAALHHHFGLDVTVQGWGAALVNDLSWRAETRFVRSTLADLETGERVTIDRDLTAFDRDDHVVFDDAWAIVEVKTLTARSQAIRQLRRVPQAREDRLSKYCLSVAALRPATVASPWQRSLRTLTASGRRPIVARQSVAKTAVTDASSSGTNVT